MGTAAALAIGPSLGLAASHRGWSLPGAILDADFARGRFAFAGRNYPSKPAFLAAIVGSEASGTITIGPYIAPTAPELISTVVSHRGLPAGPRRRPGSDPQPVRWSGANWWSPATAPIVRSPGRVFR